MKKILIILTILFSFLFGMNLASAAEGTINVIVGEEIPGVGCTPIDENGNTVARTEAKLWSCPVQKGSQGFFAIAGTFIRYLTFIAGLLGVLFIIYNGIMYSMSGIDESFKTDAKKRIIATLVGLVLLFLAGPILQLIAPWIYQ